MECMAQISANWWPVEQCMLHTGHQMFYLRVSDISSNNMVGPTVCQSCPILKLLSVSLFYLFKRKKNIKKIMQYFKFPEKYK